MRNAARSVRTGLVAVGLLGSLVLPLEQASAADPTFRVGALLPQTGSLAVFGRPTIAGVKLAVQDINAGGGVFGRPVELEVADSGDASTNLAATSVDRLIGNGADVIVGPASSAVALSVIDRVTAAGKLMVSPATLSSALSTYPDKGLYFRTAPSDPYQGQVVAQQARANKAKRLAILAVREAYGTRIAGAATQTFKNLGGKVARKVIYPYPARSAKADVAAIKAAKPDAILLAGFDESVKVIKQLRAQGLLPQSSSRPRLYVTDGSMSNRYKLPTATLNGVRGTIPGSQPSSSIADRFRAIDPGLKDFSFAQEAYDATMLAALSAVAAASDSGAAMAAKMRAVSGGGFGCFAFHICADVLRQGRDIDFEGHSGRIEFDGNGDIRWAAMGIYKYGKDNRYRPDRFIAGPVKVK